MVNFIGIASILVVVAFALLLLRMLLNNYQEMTAEARKEKRSAKLSEPDCFIKNRNYGTPGVDIVDSLRDVKIEYKGVININGQRI